jgi:hypothetical protein
LAHQQQQAGATHCQEGQRLAGRGRVTAAAAPVGVVMTPAPLLWPHRPQQQPPRPPLS